jgi:hypothetical protein
LVALAAAAVTGCSRQSNKEFVIRPPDVDIERLLPAAYPVTTTRTNASGNVSTVTEDTGARTSAADAGGSMRRVSLADPAVGILDAISLDIPVGWQFRGEIVRNVPCSPGDAFPQMQASSPDGAYSLTVMTPFFTTSQPTNFDLRSCGTVAPITSSANILTQYVIPTIRNGAQTSPPEAVPEAEKFVRAANRSGNGRTMSGDTARVRVSYTQNGQRIEEYIVGLTTVVRAQGTTLGTTVTMIEIYKAPAGKLDEFFQRASVAMAATANPEWQRRSVQAAQQAAQLVQQQGEQQQTAMQQNGQDAGAAGRAMLARTRNQIQATGRMSMDNAARSEAARHAGAVGTMNLVGNRPTAVYYFCNGSGGTRTNNNPNSPGPGWYLCN